jgi:hypothetical protein
MVVLRQNRFSALAVSLFALFSLHSLPEGDNTMDTLHFSSTDLIQWFIFICLSCGSSTRSVDFYIKDK